LHLKSITLKGFKSFAQTTNLIFEPGITCVVGPNGSGKSNIVDALAWVMGEQGAKTLRGGKMEDVIFAGTETKGPLGRAEVQLTIDNSDGALPIEYSEVAISRTLFRNGASEYAINGESCRLLDLQELLSDSGLGREMHVIVGQGQLDTVLRANPEERRAFIEEAAGILKYRRRKEKTERKLEAMKANLTRLQDLIGELRRNLKPLGRQAEVAKQAQEIAAIAREAKAKLISHQAVALRQQLELNQKSETDRKLEAEEVQIQLTDSRNSIQEIENQLLSAELEELRTNLFALESIESRARNIQNLAQQKLTLLDSPVSSSRAAGLEELKSAIPLAEASVVEITESLEKKLELLEILEKDREAKLQALSAFEADQIRARSELEQASRARAAADNEVSVLASRLSGIEQQLKDLVIAQEQSQQRALDLQKAKAELQPELSTSDNDLRTSYEAAQVAEQQARLDLESFREALHTLERERDAVSAKHAALGLTLEQSDGIADVRKANISGLSELLAEQIKIEPGYEIAIAVALGPIADAMVVGSLEKALTGLNYLKNQQLGRVEFLISSGKTRAGNLETKAGLVNAASVVTAPEVVLSQLANIYIADSLELASVALESKELSESIVITTQGDYLSDYLVRGGGSKAPSKLELIAEREAANKRLEAIAKQIEISSRDLENSKQVLSKSTELVRSSLTALQQHDAELAARAERVGRVIAQADGAASEAERLKLEINKLEGEKAKIEIDLEAAKQQLAEFPLPQGSEESSNAREAIVSQLDSARAAELEVRIETGTLKERLSGASKELATLRGRILDAERAIAQDSQAELERQAQLAKAQFTLDRVPAVIAVVEASASRIRLRLREFEADRGARLEKLSSLRIQVQSLETKISGLNQGVHEVELRNHELRLTLSNLSERSQSELGLGLDELIAQTEPDSQSREELEKALRVAEGRLAQLGAFNPLALEEFSALEERHKYLTEQLEDLNRARADLGGIIADLDSKMEHIFSAAFEDTKKEFEKIFPVLFPGGTGSISLTSPDDLLTAGVEVSVRPAGKRIERMSLLSGGERSLAAVALLIAIFKARPSPFYVLDEVEAALDDANLGRLLAVVESLRESSQLIIVTHQKRTMEIADALYGVSMRSDGITQVVGQKLQKAS
jgi:chromosome segregation protein